MAHIYDLEKIPDAHSLTKKFVGFLNLVEGDASGRNKDNTHATTQHEHMSLPVVH